jgi:hypothetical protein
MPAITCPYCRALSNFSVVHIFDATIDGTPIRHAVWTCNACGKPIIGKPDAEANPRDFYPQSVADEDFPDVPTAVSDDAREAFRCYSIDAWRASAAMARRALQAAAYEKGAPDARLIDQIDWLADNGHITAQMRDVAHQIRLGGNLGAHPDRDGLRDVGQAEAEALLIFLRDFFRYVYEIPASLGRLSGGTPATS